MHNANDTDLLQVYAPAITAAFGDEASHDTINTSHVERHNLTMRMSMGRFTRKVNAFSKKLENHALAVALYTTYYNFIRKHQTLKVTPAEAAGLTAGPADLEWLVELTDDWQRFLTPRN